MSKRTKRIMSMLTRRKKRVVKPEKKIEKGEE